MVVKAGGVVTFEPGDADIGDALLRQVLPIDGKAILHSLVGSVGLSPWLKCVHPLVGNRLVAIAADVFAESGCLAGAVNNHAQTGPTPVEEDAIGSGNSVVLGAGIRR